MYAYFSNTKVLTTENDGIVSENYCYLVLENVYCGKLCSLLQFWTEFPQVIFCIVIILKIICTSFSHRRLSFLNLQACLLESFFQRKVGAGVYCKLTSGEEESLKKS